uniref:Putative conserved secreted protein n=1 Tax=Xenopsylla cheopis TaxID=163159 RepID=A0A6M2DYX4_XENCH
MIFNLLCVILFMSFAQSVPFDLSGYVNEDAEENSTQIVEVDNVNGTKKDLYVIKTIVYEVAILADPQDDDNSTDNGTYIQEQVDLTFYNAHGNGTHIDLGDIPIPVQTNISGHIVTGITPVHAGTIPQDPEQLSALLPEGATVTLTKSENSTDQKSESLEKETSDEQENQDETTEFNESGDATENNFALESNEDLLEKLQVIHDLADAL